MRIDGEPWSFEQAKRMAHSFPTPLHRSFQKTVAYADKLRNEIHKLRARLSYHEILDRWDDPDYEVLDGPE